MVPSEYWRCPEPQTEAPARDYTGATRPLEHDAETGTTLRRADPICPGSAGRLGGQCVQDLALCRLPARKQGHAGDEVRPAELLSPLTRMAASNLDREAGPVRYLTVSGWWPR
jgi:hypothetical protein